MGKETPQNTDCNEQQVIEMINSKNHPLIHEILTAAREKAIDMGCMAVSISEIADSYGDFVGTDQCRDSDTVYMVNRTIHYYNVAIQNIIPEIGLHQKISGINQTENKTIKYIEIHAKVFDLLFKKIEAINAEMKIQLFAKLARLLDKISELEFYCNDDQANACELYSLLAENKLIPPSYNRANSHKPYLKPKKVSRKTSENTYKIIPRKMIDSLIHAYYIDYTIHTEYPTQYQRTKWEEEFKKDFQRYCIQNGIIDIYQSDFNPKENNYISTRTKPNDDTTKTILYKRIAEIFDEPKKAYQLLNSGVQNIYFILEHFTEIKNNRYYKGKPIPYMVLYRYMENLKDQTESPHWVKDNRRVAKRGLSNMDVYPNNVPYNLRIPFADDAESIDQLIPELPLTN